MILIPSCSGERACSNQARSRRFWVCVAADERAEELAIHLRSDRVHVNAGLGQELPRIFDVVDARGLDGSILEACAGQLCDVVVFFESAGDAAHPEQHALAHRFGHAAAHDHIGDSETAAGLEHAEGFAENADLCRPRD